MYGCASTSSTSSPVPGARLLHSIAATFIVVAVLLLCSSPAHAFSQRGHAFGGSFGEAVAGEPASRPSAIAVNEGSTGEGARDIYVLESANDRVARFGPERKLIEVWGFGVGGGKKYERCKEKCLPGLAGFGTGEFDNPVAIAVDNSTSSSDPSAGDVYVVANSTWEAAVIDKFNPQGELVGKLIAKEEAREEAEGTIDGVVVDSSGVVWVEREDEEEDFLIQRFNDETHNKLLESVELEVPEELFEGERPTRPGFAVDAADDLYITYEPDGKDFSEREGEEEGRKLPECEKDRCLVAELKIGVNPISLLPEAQPVIEEFDPEDTTGVGVDLSSPTESSGDVYLDNLTSVAAFTSGGALIQRFGEAQLEGGSGGGLAVDSTTGEVLVADQATGRIDDYVQTPPGSPVVKPESVSAADVTSSSAKLRATIDPTGLETHYRFLYGTVSCKGSPSPCTGIAPTEPADIGAGWIDEPVTAEVTGLAPSTTYHFVAVAHNESGGVANEVVSEEVTFTTLPSSETEAALPDGRAWELVSPPDKRGVAIEPISHEGGLIEASSDGQGIAYIAAAPAGEEEPAGNRAPEPTQLISTRRSAGSWVTRNITTPNESAQGIKAESRREYQIFSSDLSLGVVFPAEPLFGEAVSEAIYRWSSCAEGSCYAPLAATSSPAGLKVMGATPDLAHAVVYSSSAPLKSGASGAGLYEWSAEAEEADHLMLVSILPNGEHATGELGLGTLQLYEGPRNAISDDGSRLVWKAGTPSAAHLYASKLNKQAAETKVETLQVDTPEAGVEPTAKPAPVFMTASVEGARVFFTDDQRLTKDASPESESTGDLYVFEPNKPAGERVTDISPDISSGESAAVQGGVIGASEDGAYVYFVANGVLAEGAQPGDCQWGGPRVAACNLYVVHDGDGAWEKPRLIARLSNEDGPDWGANANDRTEYSLVEMTSRVSPSGRYLAFMSDRRLSTQGRPGGYENTDEKSGEPDEEVYLYDALSGHLVCASCDPSGAQPVGVHDIQESHEGRGLLVDRPGIWSSETEDSFDHWLAASLPGWTGLSNHEALYQSRYLANDGRLFFNSADSLVKQDVNGKEDVYEYEPGGVGSCGSGGAENTEGGCVALISSGKSEQESAFLDASEDGNDVFFLTSAKLSQQDPDDAFDVYDARVCDGPGAQEECPPAASTPQSPCESEGECKGAVVSPPTFGAPTSSTLSGSGNLLQQGVLSEKEKVKPKPKPLTRAQKLAAALRVCKKDKKQSKRRACERQARKRYGPTKRAKKSSARPKSMGRASSGRDIRGRS